MLDTNEITSYVPAPVSPAPPVNEGFNADLGVGTALLVIGAIMTLYFVMILLKGKIK